MRNPGFLRHTLRIDWASKRTLTVSIYDAQAPGDPAFGKLGALARGGEVSPQGGGEFAIPARQSGIERGARGVARELRPANLPDSFRRGNAIFQRQRAMSARAAARTIGFIGTARAARPAGLRLMYILRSSVSIPARVPFYEDFATGMIEALARELPAAVEKAMATAYTKAS